MHSPGTGITTVVRLIRRILKWLGVLKCGHVVECNRSVQVAEYVGQTAPRTKTVVDWALDEILFTIGDYCLVKKNEDFGQEAIWTLL